MDIKTYHGIKVYNGILDQLKNIHDTEQESLREVRHYANGFPKEADYNLDQYGNLLVYYHDIAKFYQECEYPMNEFVLSDGDLDLEKLWSMYIKDVGYVANLVLRNVLNPIQSLYKVEIRLDKADLDSVVEWIINHEEDSKRLNHTYFNDDSFGFRKPVVSVLERNSTFEKAVFSWDDGKRKCEEYKCARICRALMGLYYIECHGNVYYCTI